MTDMKKPTKTISQLDVLKQMKEYQAQTNGNFGDINDDIDGIRRTLVNIEDMTNKILKIVCELSEKEK